MELVPIKVKIGLRPNGHADHPKWELLPSYDKETAAAAMPGGWRYDKTSGHQESSADSPIGMQWGVLLVTEAFSIEALATFPTLISVLTEDELEDFWDNRAHAHMPDYDRNDTELRGLREERDLKREMGIAYGGTEVQLAKALDADDPTPGIVKNKMKKWRDAKTVLDVTIKAS